MRDRSPERLALLAGLLAAAAGAVLWAGAAREPGEAAGSEAFQRTVLGLGGGTATALHPCEAAFDGGRREPCGRSLEPHPGGEAFCPHHAGAALVR